MALIASPGPAGRALPGLSDQITERLLGTGWRVQLVADRLVESPADLGQLMPPHAAGCSLRDGGWLCV